jgi:putative transposase
MKKSRFTEERIIAILKQADAGVKIAELARKNGVSEATLYNWKARYGGLDVSQLRRLKELETENARLKKMYAELSLTHHALQDAVEKKL